ncbi:hypothetical protein [Asticcacaulis endophyticus]|uniref:Uncharacterized protein n=1 Tax=Asticcacaulis endophyticus TaxID=1395890 RepID=A0A918PU05_9CAUL|nr:hypothetical protein [Asticcacaulis endophyticus]GGZ21925.1 hypothetical protein GCM10011273_03400 [Asticcacaulis endophyticus]
MIKSDGIDPDQVIELSRDILRASDAHFMGVDRQVVVHALLALALDITVAATECTAGEAVEYLKSILQDGIDGEMAE